MDTSLDIGIVPSFIDQINSSIIAYTKFELMTKSCDNIDRHQNQQVVPKFRCQLQFVTGSVSTVDVQNRKGILIHQNEPERKAKGEG